MRPTSLSHAWIAAVKIGLAGVPSANLVIERVEEQVTELLGVVLLMESAPRPERHAAAEKLIALTGNPTPELADIGATGARLGVRQAAEGLGWTAGFTALVEQLAIDSLLQLDRRLEGEILGTGLV